MKNAFLTKNYKFLEFLKICILSLGYQTFHTKKPFRDEMFLEISVSENVYPQANPPVLCYGNFKGCMRSDPCVNQNFNFLYMDKCPTHTCKIVKIYLL